MIQKLGEVNIQNGTQQQNVLILVWLLSFIIAGSR